MTFCEALNKVFKRFSTRQAVEQNTRYVIEFSPTSTKVSTLYQKVVCEVTTGARKEITFTEWYALYRERNACGGWSYFKKPSMISPLQPYVFYYQPKIPNGKLKSLEVR